MLKFFKQLNENKNSPGDGRGALEGEEKIRVAVSALLLEVAYCDDEFSEDEKHLITGTLKKRFLLSDAESKELIETAEKERDSSVDLWHFTNLINENFTDDEKIRLIEMLWEIVYADSLLDKHEDYLMHMLSKLLKLDHKEMISAKIRAKSR